MEPYAADRVDLRNFVDRVDLLEAIEADLGRGVSILVSAGRRCGKTMLFRMLVRRLVAGGFATVYVDVQSLSGPDVVAAFLDTVVAGLDASPDSSLEDAVLTKVSKGERVALLIDEVDRLAEVDNGPQLLDNIRYLVSNSPAAGMAVVGVTGGLEVLLRLQSAGSPLPNVCRPHELCPLGDDAIRELVRIGVPRGIVDSLAETLIDQVGGHPFLAQVVLQRLPAGLETLTPVDGLLVDALAEAERRLETVFRGVDRLVLGSARRLQSGEIVAPSEATVLQRAGLAREVDGTLEINGRLIAKYASERGANEPDAGDPHVIQALITSGESPIVEFKESIRWDVRRGQLNDDLRMEIPRAIAGFLNADGGTLLLGVTSGGMPVGLTKDMSLSRPATIDGLMIFLANLLRDTLGGANAARVSFSTTSIDGNDLLALSVGPADRPVFVQIGRSTHFYRRIATTTANLDMRQAVEYALQRWSAGHA
jgi:hypothetical protein